MVSAAVELFFFVHVIYSGGAINESVNEEYQCFKIHEALEAVFLSDEARKYWTGQHTEAELNKKEVRRQIKDPLFLRGVF